MNILDDKQYKHYEYFSRYESVPYYYHKLDQKYVYGTTSHIKDNTSYILHEVKLNDKILSLVKLPLTNVFIWAKSAFNILILAVVASRFSITAFSIRQ